MMALTAAIDFYHSVLRDGDVRIANWLLVRDPLVILSLIGCYLLMVTLGPKLMKNIQAFDLKNVLVAYNFVLVTMSAWMTYELFVGIFLNSSVNPFCQPIEASDTGFRSMKLISVQWWYFFSKFIEFADTMFFILRKKNGQISFLHVYHHATMPFLQWCVIKYVPGPVSSFGPLCNSFIHTVMYAYYMLAAMGPHMQKYLWWKKYLTKMQLCQFIIVFLHTSYAIKLDCGFPNFWLWMLWVYMITLFTLFSHFYKKSYSAKAKLHSK